MSDGVFSLQEARRRRMARRGQLEPGLRLSINDKGELDIRETDRNGRLVKEWWASAEDTKKIVSRLSASIRKLAIAAWQATQPPPPPPPPEPKWRCCRLTPRGSRGGKHGCRRREGHDGPHRNRAGQEWA